jgi:hypothetical protein
VNAPPGEQNAPTLAGGGAVQSNIGTTDLTGAIRTAQYAIMGVLDGAGSKVIAIDWPCGHTANYWSPVDLGDAEYRARWLTTNTLCVRCFGSPVMPRVDEDGEHFNG